MRTQINSKSDGDCGYIAFYKSKEIELFAPTKLKAQNLAAEHFRTKKSWEVDVWLAEDKEGNCVEHTATF